MSHVASPGPSCRALVHSSASRSGRHGFSGVTCIELVFHLDRNHIYVPAPRIRHAAAAAAGRVPARAGPAA